MPDTSGLVTCTTGAGSKGSYAQLIASTSEDYDALLVGLASDTGNNFLFDIAIGGAGAEVIIAANLLGHGRSNELATNTFVLPIPIPAGTRIAARAGTTSAQSPKVCVSGIKDAFVTFDGMDSSLGAASSTDWDGIGVTSAVTPTEGAWTQLIASTTRDYDAVLPLFSNGGGFSAVGQRNLFDLAIGGSGSEVQFVTDIVISDESDGDVVWPQSVPIIRKRIPSGSRLAVRAKSTSTITTNLSCALGLLYGPHFADLAGPLMV